MALFVMILNIYMVANYENTIMMPGDKNFGKFVIP